MNAATETNLPDNFGTCACCGGGLQLLRPGSHPRVPADMRGGVALECAACGGLDIGAICPISDWKFRTLEIFGGLGRESVGDDVKYFDVMYRNQTGKLYRSHGFYNVKTGTVTQYG